MDFAGQLNIAPRLGRLHTDSTKAQVTTAGFLDDLIQSEGLALLTSDFLFVAASDGNDIVVPTFSAGVCTLDSLL